VESHGQHTPCTATTEDLEDRIQNFALRIFLRSATWFGGGDQMLNQRPFAATEVSWVRFAGFNTPMLPEVVCPRQPFKRTLRRSLHWGSINGLARTGPRWPNRAVSPQLLGAHPRLSSPFPPASPCWVLATSASPVGRSAYRDHRDKARHASTGFCAWLKRIHMPRVV